MKKLYILMALIVVVIVSACAGTTQGTSKVAADDLKAYHEGIACIECHDNASPVTPAIDTKCEACHGSPTEVAELTKDLRRNPHNSYHYSIDVPCSECHREHEASVVLCYECHTFRFDNFKE